MAKQNKILYEYYSKMRKVGLNPLKHAVPAKKTKKAVIKIAKLFRGWL